MKKTILGIMILATILVAVLATTVNAATVSASKTENVKKGDKVVVTITAKDGKTGVDAMQFKLNYNKDYFKVDTYNKGNLELDTTKTDVPGEFELAVFTTKANNTETKITVTLEALKDVPAEDVAALKVSGYVAEGDTLADTTIPFTVKVVDPKPEQPGTTDPKPEQPDNKPSVPGTDGKDHNKIPQMGTPVYVIGAIALVVIAGAVVAVKKLK